MSDDGKTVRPVNDVSLDEAVEFVLNSVPRAQLIEMYYWIQENDILKIVRGLLALPPQVREDLAKFFEEMQQTTADIRGSKGEREFTLRNERKRYPLTH